VTYEGDNLEPAFQQLIDSPDPVPAVTFGGFAAVQPAESIIVQNYITPHDRPYVLDNVLLSDPFITHLGKEGETLQETIDSYVPPFVGRNPVSLFFQIEGNFTGSGNREIMGFYEVVGVITVPNTTYGHLTGLSCFVCDAGGEKVEKVYVINLNGTEFSERTEPITGLSEVLGSPIVWRDRIIGRYGDFNRNGIDELCIFENNLYFRPFFFEFNGLEFEETITPAICPETIITDIDPEERIITLRSRTSVDAPNYDIWEKTNSYKWDEATQRYITLPDGTEKFLRWNRTTQEFEEIEI
jgi:hypothetical protein